MVQPAISLPLVSVFIKRGNINLLRHLCSIYSFLTKHGVQGFGNNDDRHDQTIWQSESSFTWHTKSLDFDEKLTKDFGTFPRLVTFLLCFSLANLIFCFGAIMTNKRQRKEFRTTTLPNKLKTAPQPVSSTYISTLCLVLSWQMVVLFLKFINLVTKINYVVIKNKLNV